MSRLFVLLSRQNSDAAVSLYNLLGGASLKENSIKVLARTNLEASDFKIIEALLKVVGSSGKLRDKICHWVWGISSEIPDGLVLVDPKMLLRQHARIAEITKTGGVPAYSDIRLPDDDVFVYRTSDLKADAQSFVDLALLVNKCHGLTFRSGPELVQLRGELSKNGLLEGRLAP